MATRRKQPDPVMFPFKGSDEENLAAARCMAQQGFDRMGCMTKPIRLKDIAKAVFVATEKTRRKYVNAFAEDKASKQLGDAIFHDDSGLRELRETAGLPNRGSIILDGEHSVVWDTKLARSKFDADKVDWVPVPKDKIKAIANSEIPENEHFAWATEFLIFASKYRLLEAGGKSKKGGIAKHERARSKPASASSSSRRGE